MIEIAPQHPCPCGSAKLAQVCCGREMQLSSAALMGE